MSTILSTTFNEGTAGTGINATAPAIGPIGKTWSDSNGDWVFKSGGGLISTNTDLVNALQIDLQALDYTTVIKWPVSGGEVMFRFVDNNNFLKLVSFSFGGVGIANVVAGTSTTIDLLFVSNPAADCTVVLSGNTVSVSCDGQVGGGTIDSSLLAATVFGMFPTSTSFVVTSLLMTGAGGAPAPNVLFFAAE